MDGARVLAAALALADRVGAPTPTVLEEYRRLLGNAPLPDVDPAGIGVVVHPDGSAPPALGGGDPAGIGAVVHPDGSAPPELLLGRLCEERLGRNERRRRGAWYTPWPLASGLVRFAMGELDPGLVSPEGPTVHDPAVGGGVFLLAAAELLVGDHHPDDVLSLLSGTDVDPLAVFAARMSLWLWNRRRGGSAPPPEGLELRDGLTAGDSHDLTVGNPPFGGRLRDPAELPGTVDGSGAYTDLAGLFLLGSLRRTRPGGVVAMIQPTSVLASRDAAPVRAEAAVRGRTAGIWRGERVFSAQVDVCAPVVAVGPISGPVGWSRITILGGPGAREIGTVEVAGQPTDTMWSRAVARAAGVPEPVLAHTDTTLGDVAVVTADFRDQYYGLVELLDRTATGEGGSDGGSVAVVTVGLIDPLRDLTPVRTTRLGRVVRDHPRIGREALSGSPLARWASSRLVPKVLVASQTRVVEAIADPEGTVLPCTPVLSVIPTPAEGPVPHPGVWLLAAALVAPTAAAWLAARATGSGLSAGAFRVRCGQLRDLPLPPLGGEWDRAAELARRAQLATTGAESRALLLEVGRTMCGAYGISRIETSELMEWWEGRLPPVRG